MNKLFRAVGGIDDALIEEAEAPPRNRKSVYWIPVALSAAAAAAIAGLFVMNARRTPEIPLTPHTAVVATQTDPAVTESAAAPTTVFTTAPTTEPPPGSSVPVLTTVITTIPTTATTTSPSTVPTTAPTPVTVATAAPTTSLTTQPTTIPTTIPTTQPPTVPTTEPTSAAPTVPTTAPQPTAAPTTAAPTDPTQPATDPEPETEPPTRMQPEGDLAVLFIDGEAFYTSEDADLRGFSVTERLGIVQPAPLYVPLGEPGKHHFRAFSPEPGLVGADVYRLIPIPGNSVPMSEKPTQYYLLEIDGQSIICEN